MCAALSLRVEAHHDNKLMAQAFDRLVEERLPKLRQVAASKPIVKFLNAHYRNLPSLELVLQRDQEWRDLAIENRPLLRPQKQVVTHELDALLAADKLIAEILLMDANGATLYAEPMPTDFWQGDEDKFIQPALSHKVFVGETGYDLSSGTYQVQVSIPIFDRKKVFLGAMFVGIELPLELMLDLEIE